MRTLICPISPLRVNENVVRVTAFLIAALAIFYVFVPNPFVPLLLIVDFYIRAFTTLKYSPLSWIAAQTNHLFKLPVVMTDKAKKIFAARIGFLFAVAMLILFFVYPVGSIVAALILATFALLESIFNVCVGCLVYTYFVFPYFKPSTDQV